MCLHGIRAYGRRFARLAEERLADRFRVLAFDLRGHGASGFDPPWNLATHFADVLETADAVGVGRATWVGHSFGGRLALELAARTPDRIERGILLDPSIEVPPERAREGADSERPERAYTSVEEAIRERVESGLVKRTPREFLEEEMREHLVPSPDGRLRLRYSQPAAVTAWGESAAALPSLSPVPMLLVTGAESGFVTEPQAELLRRTLGELLEEVVVPGGHVVLWDGFAETADAIEAFLARTARL